MTRTSFSRGALLALTAAVAGVIVGIVTASNASAGEGARRHGYSNKDFRGGYAFLETGTALGGQDWYEIASVRADGVGTATVEFTGTLGGHTEIAGTAVCAYDVQKNGMGFLDCVDPEGNQITYKFVLHSDGRELLWISAPHPDIHVYGTAHAQ